MTEVSQSEPKHFFQNFLLAGTVSAFSKTLVAPIETYFTYPPVSNPEGLGLLQRILKYEGFSGFWKHNLRKIRTSSPFQGFNFAFYDLFKGRFCSSVDPKMEFWKFLLGHIMAGAAAGGLTQFLFYPLNPLNSSVKPVIDDREKLKFSKEEILKRYKWFSLSAVGVMVYRGVLFGGYETAKRVLFNKEKESKFVGKYSLALGMASAATLLSNPVDVVRRRMMMKSMRAEDSYKSALDCARETYREEGRRVFLRGSQVRMVFGIAAALNLVLYDELQKYLFREKIMKIF